MLSFLPRPRIRRVTPALMYRQNIYSQCGEDGIFRELVRRLPERSQWVCEFGAVDGKKYSNTFLFVERQGYHAVYIEPNETTYPLLVETAKEFPTILPFHTEITVEGDTSLESILARTPIPKDFDILSIDIDSYDYQVWKSLTSYTPKFVVIEINSGLNPMDPSAIYGEGSSEGTGFLPMARLGESKGYTLLCHTGNLIFVRNDLAPLYQDLLVPMMDCYQSTWGFSG